LFAKSAFKKSSSEKKRGRVRTWGLPGFFSRGSVPSGGPTASRACENWRDPGAGAAPNPDKAPGSVPVPGGVGCFRAEKLQQFFFVNILFLK
jgi:hypothetical protein